MRLALIHTRAPDGLQAPPVARIIADLAGTQDINEAHIAEAIQFRQQTGHH